MSDKVKHIINSVLFFTIFAVVFFLNVVLPDDEISASERRRLRQFPELTLENVLSAEFQENFDLYVVDQFIFRDTFRLIKGHFELDVLRQMDNNNLFVRDGFIFSMLYPLNERGVTSAANRMNSVYDLWLIDMNVFYTIIPDKNFYLNTRHLRIDYEQLVTIMNSTVRNMQYIDIFDTLTLNSFYRTDIHWRQEKLDPTVKRIADYMDFSLFNLFEEKSIPNFRGSYFGQLPRIGLRPDTLTYLTNDILESATVFHHETNTYSNIYNLDMVDNVDMYDIFLSGPTAVLDIHNPNSRTDRELIIFRDSFGSSIIPLMIQDFRKITVVDLRYVDSRILDQFIEFNNQDVIFMLSVNILNNGHVLR